MAIEGDEGLEAGQDAPPSSHAGLLRSSAVVGIGTSLSRLSGFARLAATAYAIGFTRLTDTYTLANNTPNIVYDLLLGGVLSATLVPVFVEHVEEGDDEGTSAVISVAATLLAVFTVVGLIAAPWIVRLYTVGVSGTVGADERGVATNLLRLFMPQMFFYGLTALFTALLNAHRRFAIPAFAPVLNNLVVTVMFLALPHLAGDHPSLGQVRRDDTLLLVLGLGTTAGIVLMTVVLWPALRQAGIRLRPNFDWRHRAVRQVGRMSGWTVGYVVANQIALLVVLVLANRGEAGEVAAYTGAYVFFQLPHALFAVSLMTTIVPELSTFASRGDWTAYRDRFSIGIRLMALVVLPAAAGYAILARPIVSALLQRGAFSGASADLTGHALAAFAFGLFGFSVYLFTLRGFYAMRDARTPFVINVFENGVNLVLAFPLEARYGVTGLALAFGIAYTVSALVALVVLRQRAGSLDGRRVARSMGKVALAVAIMAAAVELVSHSIGANGGNGAIVRTAVGVVVGGGVYVVAVLALRVEEVDALRARLLRRGTA